MCPEDALCEGASLEEGIAQEHRVAHTAPDRAADIPADGDILHQHPIDGHADHDEECLEAQSEQGAEVILPHAAPFPSQHGRHGDGG